MPSRFRQPLEDLEIARSEIAKMKETKSFRVLVEAWQNFLMRIERSWQSAEREIRGLPRAQQWFQPYAALRKTDPLLVFLRHARNAEMHAASSTISKPIALSVLDRSGRGFHLKSVSTRFEGGKLTIDLGSDDILLDVDAKLVPTDPEIMKFKSRGEFYEVPRTHLRRKIERFHPVPIAELGLDFYRTFVSEAEAAYGGT